MLSINAGSPSVWWGALRGLQAVRARSREEIEAHQSRLLRSLIGHAARRVPYYRRLFERKGLQPEQIRRPADLACLPILTRADVRENQDHDLLSEDVDPGSLLSHDTHATTGYSLTIRRTVFEERFLQGLRLLHSSQLGLRPRDRRVVVRWSDPESPADRGEQTWWTRLGLLRMEVVDCRLPPDAILARLRDLRPDVLTGYPGSLALLAGCLTGEDRCVIRPRLIVTGGEKLTAGMRRLISQSFGVKVFDYYASSEFILVAAECPRGAGRYHVCESSLILEVERDGQACQPGESGELIGTALYSRAMPLLRYRLGDQVTLGETGCPCGAPVKTLLAIDGRTAERFLRPDGDTFHPYVLEGPLSVPWLRQYQLVQELPARVVLHMVPMRGERPSPEELSSLGRKLTAVAGNVQVVPKLVEEIPAGPNGKFRLYVPLAGEWQDGRGDPNRPT